MYSRTNARPHERQACRPGRTYLLRATSTSRYGIQAIDLSEALAAILADTAPVTGSETVATADAVGRVAARAVTAPVDLPPFPASAMDGYAVRAADLEGPAPHHLPVAGISAAGHPYQGAMPALSAVRIFTGAALPDEADTVVIQEDCTPTGRQAVTINVPVTEGDNVRPAGHDVELGAVLVSAGDRISPFHASWLAACGVGHIEVKRRPKVAVFSTGDELVTPGTALGPGQIYDANRQALLLLLRELPIVLIDRGLVADDRSAIRDLLQGCAADADAIITSGGVSVGDADWVKQAVAEVGTLTLWKLNLKPGKPLAYGRAGKAHFFGLPGNPVSTIVTALLVARPALLKLAGARPEPPLEIECILRTPIEHRPGREEFQRGLLTGAGAGLEVRVTGDQSSNRLSTFVAANCLIRVPKNSNDLAEGSRVSVLPFGGLLSGY
ncbi:MAG: molybdopterin molybdotransferase MoeA [Pseudomonadales bacterium]